MSRGSFAKPVRRLTYHPYTISEESERISELKSMSGTNRLPAGSLAAGVEGIKSAITNFEDACVSHLGSFSIAQR